MRKTLIVLVSAASAVAATAAMPQLKSSAEPIASAGIKAKLLAKAKEKILVTPASQRWRLHQRSRNGEEREWEEKHYDVREIWYRHELAGQWTDPKENVQTIAKVSSPCPQFEEDHAKREDIDAKIAESAESFKEPDDAALAKWATAFNGKSIDASAISPFAVGSSAVPDARLVDLGSELRVAALFKTRDGAWHWADFALVQPSRPREREAMMKTFLKSVAVDAKAKAAAAPSQGGGKLKGYEFESDLPPSLAEDFIKRANVFLLAMRTAYRRYVPPQKEVGLSKVRVFYTREAYDKYAADAGAGELGARSVGLWSTAHEELLILYRGKDSKEKAKTLKTMRHEAFHQYLFYATGGKEHAMWFNEGHACFFENARFDKSKNQVFVFDDLPSHDPSSISRCEAVDKNPEKFAHHIKKILMLDHNAFYSGSLRDVNANYAAAWAVVYFLQKGAPSLKEFAPYRNVLPTYLKEMAAGKTWEEATKAAWSLVEDRDIAADFLKFWNKRNSARFYEPGSNE